MIINKDCIEGMKEMEESSVDCIVTSPPYNKKGLLGKVKQGNQIWGKFQIDYNTYGDDMPEDQYQAWMVEFLNECHRVIKPCLLYTSPSPRDQRGSRMPSSA